MKKIIIGHANNLLRLNKDVENEAVRRLQICNSCPMKKVKMSVAVCGNCGCPLQALARQNEKICSFWVGSTDRRF